MRSRLVCACALVVLGTAGCGKGEPDVVAPPGPVTRTDPDAVHVEGAAFRDGRGRQLLFRGYNVKVPGLFDVTFDDGRKENESIVEFTEDDAARLEELGLDAVRLAINWSALEPRPQEYSEKFFTGIAAFLDMARRHHFYVFLDMHEDAYSKEIGEDGAPLWAIVPPPTKLLEGPSDGSRITSDQVVKAGLSFFSNAPATDGRPLQDAFAAAVEQLVLHFAGDPVVLGYEALNEPVLIDHRQLDSFHEKVADAIHAVDADAPILFEPMATRNQTDQALIPTEPWSHGPGAYAPHIYTGWFSLGGDGWASLDPTVLAPSMEHADLEAKGWGTPLIITEFGCDQSVDKGTKWLAAELDLQDRYLASSTQWVFREGGTWGLSDNQRTERAATARVAGRPYPRKVAGDLLAIEHPADGHLLVKWRATERTAGLAHEVSVSTASVTSFKILCDGTEVTAIPSIGRAEFTCPPKDGDRTFEVIGVPTPP